MGLFVSNIFPQLEITRNITIDDGLSYSEVTCAFKDFRGIIWFGTSAGLSEWNSVYFTNYYGTDGLPSSFIKSICEDKDNVLYVATTKGLVIKSNNRFLFPPNLPDELKTQINELYLSKNGVLYILSEKYGLWKKENNNFERIDNNDNEIIIPVSILERKNGKILIGTRANGIYVLDDNSLKRFIMEEFYKEYPVTDMAELNQDTLYIALQGFGLVINSNNGKAKNKNLYFTVKDGLPDKNINDLELTENKQLYIATTKGIAVFKNNKVIKKITQINGLLNEFILKIFSMNNDTFFFLSEGNGVFVYIENSFITYNKNSGLLHNNVWRIKELQDSSFCFLTDGGISLLKGNKFSSITTKNGLGDNLVVTLFEDKNKDLYVGTYSDGINIISDNKIIRLNKKSGMFENSVSTILRYKENRIFFISRSKGIAVFDGQKIIDTLKYNEALPNNDILSSYKKKDGTILIGVEDKGLYKYNGKKFIPYFNKKENCSIWAIYEDEIGNLYLGTNEKGLIRYSLNGKRDTINVKKGLSNNTVVGIVGDNNGNIYAGTDKGLNIIRFLNNGKTEVRQLYKQSGLANSECNQGALYKDKSGYIWVGTIGGVTKINPEKIVNKKYKVPIIFTSIGISDEEYTFSDSLNNLNLKYYENDIIFGFVGINYLEPKIVKYRYKLEGTDKHWIINKNNEVRYSKLPPGEYNFKVAVSDAWGTWSKPIGIFFVIQKPFWQRWWFMVFILFSIIFSVYAIMNYRLKNALRLEKLRAKISADLHDEIGSGLSEISILSELLKYNKTFDQKLVDGLNQIGDSTRRLIKSLSDIIWIVDPGKESLGDLINRIQNTYQEVFFQANINLRINNIEQLNNLKLHLEVRQNLYLIIKEAVNNALKYSKCKNITINIKKLNSQLIFEIIDDGIGISESDYEKGNGLYNMKKRAKTIKADFAIESNNNGTKILIKIPVKEKGIKW